MGPASVTMAMTLDAKALVVASSVMSAAGMLVLGILGNLGVYEGAVAMMAQWHLFFDLSAIGILTGMVEAAVITALAVGLWAWLYNWTETDPSSGTRRRR